MTRRMNPLGMRLLGNGSLLFLMLACPSCSKSTGTVSGTVTFDGNPLPGGTVIFHAPEGRVLRAPIATDGAYSLADVPVGPAQITVIPRQAPVSMRPAPDAPSFRDLKPVDREFPEASKDYLKIPNKYRDPEQSGLTCVVHSGNQTIDVGLFGRAE